MKLVGKPHPGSGSAHLMASFVNHILHPRRVLGSAQCTGSCVNQETQRP